MNTPISISILVEDGDISSVEDAIEHLAVTLLSAPSNGTLIGDLQIVAFHPPTTALVEIAYCPADGFLGTDGFVVQASHTLGGIAISTISVTVQARNIGSLSGNWRGNVGLDPDIGFTVFRTDLTLVYRVPGFTSRIDARCNMGSSAGVKQALFESFVVDTSIDFTSVSIHSTLAFDPDALPVVDMFDYWLTSMRFSLADVDFTHTFYLRNTQTDSYQALSVHASIGDVGITNNLRLNMDTHCGFPFSSNDTTVTWPWCGVTLQASIGFTCDGFDRLTIGAHGIPLPGFWFAESLGVLDSSICLDMDGKSMATNIDWRPGGISCFKLLTELDLSGPGAGSVSGDTIFEGIHIYGLRFECDVPSVYGDIKFVSATALESSYNSIVTGQTDYFEVVRLSGPLLSCCGYPGSWSVATYFNESATMLFDWGMTLIRADVVISDHFNFTFETVFRSGFFGDPNLELTVGWMTRW